MLPESDIWFPPVYLTLGPTSQLQTLGVRGGGGGEAVAVLPEGRTQDKDFHSSLCAIADVLVMLVPSKDELEQAPKDRHTRQNDPFSYRERGDVLGYLMGVGRIQEGVTLN